MENLVYLAGPVKGLSYGASMNWREYAKKELAKYDIIGVSPMRAKEFLASEQVLTDRYDALNVLASSTGITVRDQWDVRRSTLFLANLIGAEQITIGTMIEYGWASAYDKPIITVIEKQGNLHDHSILRRLTGFRVETLDEGLHVARALLCT